MVYFKVMFLSGVFLTTIFNAILLHKKSIRVTWRLQTIFNATIFVAATRRTTLNKLEIPTTFLQYIDCQLHGIDLSLNKIVPCSITRLANLQKYSIYVFEYC